MSNIPTLTNIDRAEPRNPENMRYTAAAEAVYPAGRPWQQHRQEAPQRKIETPEDVFGAAPVFLVPVWMSY